MDFRAPEFHISVEFSQLAEIIQDYDHNLELCWIPPADRATVEERAVPYCIKDKRTNSVVMFCSEREHPQEILARLFNADNEKGNVLDKLESQEVAKKVWNYKNWIDKQQEARELGIFALKNEKSRIKHDGVWRDENFKEISNSKRIILP